MNPLTNNNPTGERPKERERRIDLEAAYRVLIRAYLRRRMLPQRKGEVKHG